MSTSTAQQDKQTERELKRYRSLIEKVTKRVAIKQQQPLPAAPATTALAPARSPRPNKLPKRSRAASACTPQFATPSMEKEAVVATLPQSPLQSKFLSSLPHTSSTPFPPSEPQHMLLLPRLESLPIATQEQQYMQYAHFPSLPHSSVQHISAYPLPSSSSSGPLGAQFAPNADLHHQSSVWAPRTSLRHDSFDSEMTDDNNAVSNNTLSSSCPAELDYLHCLRENSVSAASSHSRSCSPSLRSSDHEDEGNQLDSNNNFLFALSGGSMSQANCQSTDYFPSLSSYRYGLTTTATTDDQMDHAPTDAEIDSMVSSFLGDDATHAT